MSKKLNTLTKFAMAAGVALLTTMAGNLAPAKAVGLNLSTPADQQQTLLVVSPELPHGFPNSANPGTTGTDPTKVPEPSTIVGSLVVLGMGLQMKRKMKKGDL